MTDTDLVPGAEHKAMRRLHELGQKPLVREGGPLLGLYGLYSFMRWFVARGDPDEPFANAFKLIALEKQLGMFYEPAIQKELIDHAQGVVHFANWFYTFGYIPALLLTAVLLYRYARERFYVFKHSFFLGLGLALIGYTLFPLAPPRMLPELGFVDTLQAFGSNPYNQRSVLKLYNPYAAMPSLHFGWTLLVGMVACSFDRRGLKLVGVSYPCCMAFAIVVNGNHYILDIAGGAIVVGLAYALVRALPAVKRALLAGTAGTSRRKDSAQSFRLGEPV